MTCNISWLTKERSEFRGSLCELPPTWPSLQGKCSNRLLEKLDVSSECTVVTTEVNVHSLWYTFETQHLVTELLSFWMTNKNIIWKWWRMCLWYGTDTMLCIPLKFLYIYSPNPGAHFSYTTNYNVLTYVYSTYIGFLLSKWLSLYTLHTQLQYQTWSKGWLH